MVDIPLWAGLLWAGIIAATSVYYIYTLGQELREVHFGE